MEAFGPLVLGVARHYMRERGIRDRALDAEDIYQSTFIEVMTHAQKWDMSRFESANAFKAYVLRIAVNFCFRQYNRAKKRTLEPLQTADEPAMAERLGSDIREPTSTRIDVETALAKMKQEHQVAIRLRDLLGLTFEEAAAIENISAEAMRKRYNRAAAIFKRLIASSVDTPPAESE